MNEREKALTNIHVEVFKTKTQFHKLFFVSLFNFYFGKKFSFVLKSTTIKTL